MKNTTQLAKKLFISTLIVSLGVGSLVATTRAESFTTAARATLPSDLYGKVTKTTTITDRNGEVLYYLYKDTNRLLAPSDQIAQTIKDAMIAAEDERFYHHNGVDLISVMRAAKANYLEKTIVSGGSTLTMQLVKNLTGDDRPSLDRKINEAYLATVLEGKYTKDEILTAYLNMVPLGNNLAGVETASRFYFNKPASQLTLPEAATIAALPTAPEHYATAPAELKKRRDYVLRRMRETGKIDEPTYQAALVTDTPISTPNIPLKAPHFVMTVVNQLKREYGDDLYRKGFTVVTSLDIPTQIKAEGAVKDNVGNLRTVGAQNVGLVSLDPKTGHVLAMVGSSDYDNKANRGEVNFTTANLSYGSTLKPILYAFLMEKEHWSPGAIMWDVRTSWAMPGEPKPYTPQNYDRQFFGPLTLRQALANSRNITAIKALDMVGLKTVLERLQNMGVTSLGTDTSKYGPSLAVGGGGIPLLELTGAYTAFANEGRVNKPLLIKELKDYTGKTVKEYQPSNKQILKPEVAYEIAEILQDNEARKRVFGTNSQLVVKGKTVAAKTGTAEDYRSALTIGFTPDIVTGVIVANNNNEPLIAGGSGAMAAAPFWNAFMTNYLADKPNNWFARPESVKETEFATVIGKIKDLTAPWQSPTDRFNRRVAETDNPAWNIGVRSFGSRRNNTAVATNENTQSTESRDSDDSERNQNRGRGQSNRSERD